MIAGPLALIAVSDWAVPAAYDLLVCGFGALLLINLMHLSGLYRIEFTRRPYMAVCRLVLAWTVTAAAVAIPLLYGLSSPQSQGLWLLAWIGGGFATTSAGRLVLAGAIQRWREQGRLRQRVAVLGSGDAARALPIVEIVAPGGNYDYEHKYFSDETQYLCPADLPEALARHIQELCVRAYCALGCEGWGRADVMLDADGRPWLLEMNTSPGMTGHSLVPMAAKAAGMSYAELCVAILSEASCKVRAGGPDNS